MRARLRLVALALLAFPVAAAATSPREVLLSRDGKAIAFGPAGSRTPARPGLAAAVEMIDGEVPPSTPITTLSDSLQRAAERSLGSVPGVLVALDPETGEVLALVANRDPLQPEIEATAPRPPGSTYKIVTAAAALESGRYDPSTKVACPARLDLQGRTIRTFTGAAPEGLTLTEAFARSCNTAFAQLGLSLGREALIRGARAFGLEERVLHGGSAPHVRRPSTPTEVASLGAGITNVRLTPPALAGIAATVGNGGMLVRPHFVRTALDPTRAVSPSTAEALVGMMEKVVAEGTGLYARVDGAAIAGKTGTVDRTLPSGREVDDAWFVALAPSRGPRLAVAVLLPRAGFGGERAAPLVGHFLRATRFYWDTD